MHAVRWVPLPSSVPSIMVIACRSLLLVAIISVVIAVVCARPLPASRRTGYRAAQLEVDVFVPGETLRDDDGTARSERSTNLSHITGTARKIQMYVKNKHLQILPDGTVNGTVDDGSDYAILQRTSVNNGQLKIQGVATCLFLCMDSCGLLYGSREFTEDCVFNEMIEQHHYNTYSSARYSDRQRTLYLALNQRGQARKVQVRGRKTLGKMSTYARVLTKPVPQERVDQLVARVLRVREESGARTPSPNPLRHHGYHLLCPQVIGHELADDSGRDKFRCRTRKKRKKKKRRCRDDEEEGEHCEKDGEEGVRKKRKCDEADEECPKKAGNNGNKKKCLAGDVECKKREAREQAKGRNQKKCEKGECKNNEGGKDRNNKCEKSDNKDECQRRVDAARDRRRCEKEDDEEECRKRLKEARKRRTKARDKKVKDSQDDTTRTRKPSSPGKNKKKFVGEGEISKDLDSGRRLADAEVEVATNLNTPSEVVTLPTTSSTPGRVASVDAPTEPTVTTPVDQRASETEETPIRTVPRPGATTTLPRRPYEPEWP